MWRIFLILVLLIPEPVQSAGTDWRIETDTYLSSGLGDLGTIHITEGVTVTIPEASELTFRAGSKITGKGNLVVLGTQLHPVVLRGNGWSGIDIEGDVTIRHAHISGATGYLAFAGGKTVLSNITFLDIPDSRLFFWPKHQSSILLESITVQWNVVEKSVGKAGVFISGPSGEIVINKLVLPRSSVLPQTPLIEVTNGYRGLQLIGVQSLDGCFTKTHSFERLIVARYTIAQCTTEVPSLLFVPGFGASTNFTHLTDPDPSEPVLTGWSLAPFVTNGYKRFLEEARLRGVNTSTAFYDWRLRPSDIVEQYLIPHIDALKKRDNVGRVYLVAHSYGGIIARWYIQSTLYRNDVAGLVLMGVPNEGAIKAYAPWQAAVFPQDWQILGHLTRLYRYLRKDEVSSELQALRTYIPSGLALQPLGGVLLLKNAYPLRSLVHWPNTHLSQISNTTSLRNRMPLLFTVSGTSSPTNSVLSVGDARPRATYWPDGEQMQALTPVPGDGTVPFSSSTLPGVSNTVVAASHMDIPEAAAYFTLNQLYPRSFAITTPPLRGAQRDIRNILWFAFDCPVTVTITDPSGRVFSSLIQEESEDVAVSSNAEAIWMQIPRLAGEYKIEVTALEDTPVRWWQGLESIHTMNLKKGAVRTVSYGVPKEDEEPIAVTASDTPAPSDEPPATLAQEVFSPSYPALTLPGLPERFWQTYTLRSFSHTAELPQESKKAFTTLRPFLLLALPALLLKRKAARQLPGSPRPP